MTEWDDFDGPDDGRAAERLKRLVRYQRWLVAVVLAQLALWGGSAVLMVTGRHAMGAGFTLTLTEILGAAGAVFVLLAAWEVRGAVPAFLLACATVVPGLGLLVLAMVHGYVSAELRKHDVEVGAFGASPTAVDERPGLYDDEDAGW
jgi:hypothetical protein